MNNFNATHKTAHATHATPHATRTLCTPHAHSARHTTHCTPTTTQQAHIYKNQDTSQNFPFYLDVGLDQKSHHFHYRNARFPTVEILAAAANVSNKDSLEFPTPYTVVSIKY
jgi:hypothetical protein